MPKWEIKNPKECFATAEHYTINGKKYIRVTESLGVIGKPGLLSWFLEVGRAKANEIITNRQTLGTTVHKLIELTLKNETFNLGNYELEIQTALKKFDVFKVAAKLKDYALEVRLWNDEYGYAGTADYIGMYKSPNDYLMRGANPKFEKSSLVIGDWKTSRAIYDEYWLQLAAYVKAFEERTGIKPAGVFIAHIRDDTIKIKEKTYDELMTGENCDWEGYKSTIGLYKWKFKKRMSKWNVTSSQS